MLDLTMFFDSESMLLNAEVFNENQGITLAFAVEI